MNRDAAGIFAMYMFFAIFDLPPRPLQTPRYSTLIEPTSDLRWFTSSLFSIVLCHVLDAWNALTARRLPCRRINVQPIETLRFTKPKEGEEAPLIAPHGTLVRRLFPSSLFFRPDQAAPKVDQPEAWRLHRSFLGRNGERTRLDEEVAMGDALLEESAYVQSKEHGPPVPSGRKGDRWW